MSALKKIADTIAKWPTWGKVTAAFFLFAAINAIVNPPPKVTPEQKAAMAAQEAAKDAAEKAEKLQRDNENTAVYLAHQMVKESLNDPDSVEWLGTFVYKNLDTCVNFSAKNGFGGRVKGYAAFIDGKLTVNNLKAWNKRCGDAGATRYY